MKRLILVLALCVSVEVMAEKRVPTDEIMIRHYEGGESDKYWKMTDDDIENIIIDRCTKENENNEDGKIAKPFNDCYGDFKIALAKYLKRSLLNKIATIKDKYVNNESISDELKVKFTNNELLLAKKIQHQFDDYYDSACSEEALSLGLGQGNGQGALTNGISCEVSLLKNRIHMTFY
ncbi:MAG: hypothetical protein QX197_14440 [Methylococcaceae bacterium]